MNYREITSKRQFKDSTGFSREDFDCLLSDMERTYHEQNGQTYQEYQEFDVCLGDAEQLIVDGFEKLTDRP